MLTGEGIAAAGKDTTGMWTGVLLVHKLIYSVYKKLLSCCLNHCTISCTSSSDMIVWTLRAILNDPNTLKSDGDKSGLYAGCLRTVS